MRSAFYLQMSENEIKGGAGGAGLPGYPGVPVGTGYCMHLPRGYPVLLLTQQV